METTLTKPAHDLPEFTRELIRTLAFETPSLKDLTVEQAEAVARSVLGDHLKDQMRRAVLSARIDFGQELSVFLSDRRSPHTVRTYAWALEVFERWLAFNNLHLAELTPAQADAYIRDQRATGNDADSVRLKSSAVSSFHSFLERRYVEIRNPFRGSRARPRESWPTAVIPTPEEIQTILDRADLKTRAAIGILVETGLRVGALAELRIWADGRFATVTKGKRFQGFESLSSKVRDLIGRAGLAPGRPFAPSSHMGRRSRVEPSAENVTLAISSRISRLCRTLAKEGKIAAAYSPHDFRHAFAEANVSRGMIWLRDRLGHSSVGVTERYLRNSLGVRPKG